ncbi:MAG: LPP20 family lipoprotein [Treponema sp.]|jgi:hypothetical protein|nr:LPP20 family lipoprotein [Treponema sp.]
MKKYALALLIAAAVLSAGCKSKPESYKDDPRSKIVGAEGVSRPEWMSKTPKSDELYYVVGDGRPAQTDTAKRGTARSDALAKLSQWKSAVVTDSLKNYVEEGGSAGNTQALQRFEQATIARSKANISGFGQEDYWVDPDGVYHILFSYPKADLHSDFSKSAEDFRRNEAAAFAEFKAEQAFRYLEETMNKE